MRFLQSCIADQNWKEVLNSILFFCELSVQFEFSSFDKNWTWTAAQLIIELFWTEFKVNSERVECHLLKKGRNYRILCVMTWKKPSSSSFPQGGTPLSLNWLWTQFKKVQWWVGQQFKFSFCRMNWTWVDCWVQCRELNLNWTIWTLCSSAFIRHYTLMK